MALLDWDFGMGKTLQMLAVKLLEFQQRYGEYRIKHVRIFLGKILLHFALA
jgi:hypothetical protein